MWETLSQLQPGKATGPDSVPTRLLKECAEEISPSLCKLFNTLLSAGHFPSIWKDAVIVPIFKSGSKENVENYRGISLLSIVSKVLERCVHNHMFAAIKPSLYKLQDGFVGGRSCVTSLLRTTHNFAKALDDRQQIDVLYLDYSKAFDSVSHRRLIGKLHSIGIRGSLLKWLKSYVSGRRHKTVIDGEASSWLPVKSGVPQGSILGPLLFVTYVNDLAGVVDDNSIVQLYADDTKCYRLISDRSDQLQLQSDLDKLQKWSTDQCMSFNIKKCRQLCVTKKRNPLHYDYFIGSTCVPKALQEKDLAGGCLSRTTCHGTTRSAPPWAKLTRCSDWSTVLVVTTVIDKPYSLSTGPSCDLSWSMPLKYGRHQASAIQS